MARVEIIGAAKLYRGDCREIFPTLGPIDCVVTDPPYPDYFADEFLAEEFDPEMLASARCKQFIFWSPRAAFPLDYSAIHIWHKTGAGNIASYERIYERNGAASFRVFTGCPVYNTTMARFAKDEWYDHPAQKPISLMSQLITETSGVVVDPFMGSGSTGVAAIKLGRQFIGIEVNPKYFEIACRRAEAAAKQCDMFVAPAKQETFKL